MGDLTLYNITNKFVDIIEKAQEGELTEAEYNELGEELALELQNKSTGIIAFARNTEQFIAALKGEEKRLAEVRKSAEIKLEHFKGYVKDNMERLGLDKIDTGLGTLSIAKNPMSVEIIEEELIPNEFKQEVITIKIDKTAIKEHYKETGEEINGIKIVEDKTNLRIK